MPCSKTDRRTDDRAPTLARGVTTMLRCLTVAGLVVAGCDRLPQRFQEGAQGLAGPDTVVLVTIDTLRADRLGLYGYPQATSPWLDQLGARGVVFARAMSSSSNTAPSHASIFTALEPVQHGLQFNGQPLGEAHTMAQMLTDRGYESAAFVGTTFLDTVARGFGHFDGVKRGSKPPFRAAPETLARARAWLEAPERRGRQFLWLHFYDVHENYNFALPFHQDVLDEVRRPLPDRKSLESYWIGTTGLRQEDLGDYSREVLDRYDIGIRIVDRALERFAATLAEQRRDVLWVVTADHGEGLWTRGHKGHSAYVYQEQLHVPLIVQWTAAGWPRRRVDGLVRLVDLLPTVAELTGGPVEQVVEMAGSSLVPLLSGAERRGTASWAFSQNRAPRGSERYPDDEALFAIQDRRYKLILHSRSPHELFDLTVDPFERDNLADAPPPDAARAASTLRRIFAAVRATAVPGTQPAELDPALVRDLRALGYL